MLLNYILFIQKKNTKINRDWDGVEVALKTRTQMITMQMDCPEIANHLSCQQRRKTGFSRNSRHSTKTDSNLGWKAKHHCFGAKSWRYKTFTGTKLTVCEILLTEILT
jgi:hypothetical protein